MSHETLEVIPRDYSLLLVAEAEYKFEGSSSEDSERWNETDVDSVEFGGQHFSVCFLLNISQSSSYRPSQVAEFRELVKSLNVMGRAKITLRESGVRMDLPPVFFSNGEDHYEFGPALDRMTKSTTWKIKLCPSFVNPGKGTDVHVMVPR